jgi:hypothetical protein
MGSPQPKSKSFIGTVRKDSSRFAREVRGVHSGDDLRELAGANVASWASAARVVGEEHYAAEFTKALAAAGYAGNGAAVMSVHANTANPLKVLQPASQLSLVEEMMRADGVPEEDILRPSNQLALERMERMRADGVPEEDILQGEQTIATLESGTARVGSRSVSLGLRASHTT